MKPARLASRDDDSGSAAVLGLALIGFVLLLAAALGAVGALLRARVEVLAAADAAALAAAPVTFRPFGAAGTPAQEAARFAVDNGTRLVRCVCPVDPSWGPREVEVEVEKQVRLWPAGLIAVRATSRAEFTPGALLDD